MRVRRNEGGGRSRTVDRHLYNDSTIGNVTVPKLRTMIFIELEEQTRRILTRILVRDLSEVLVSRTGNSGDSKFLQRLGTFTLRFSLQVNCLNM